jgi:hypothetical protein
MTLQAGERLGRLRMSRRCWASLFTRCTAGGTRATARSAIGLVVMCGTAGRPSRLGLRNRSTSASTPGADQSAPCVLAQLPEPSRSRLEKIFEDRGCPGCPLPAAHVNVRGQRRFGVPKLVGGRSRG